MKRILTAVLALTALAAPAVANADGKGHGRGNKHGHYKHDRGDRDWDDRDERRAYRQGYREGRRYERGYDQRPYVYVQPRAYYGSPAYQPRVWYRGQVLPHDYRRYVIYDPYRYGLYAPPRGHAWMHVDNDVYLTQLGSGLIVEVLRDSFY